MEMSFKTINPSDMPQETVRKPSAFEIFPSGKRVLPLNGTPAISYHELAGFQQGSIFLAEKSLIMVTEGALQLNFGKWQHLVTKDQMALIRDNTLVEIQSTGVPLEFISIVLDYELIREFTKLSRLSSPGDAEPSEIVLGVLNNHLRKYADSLRPYFEDSFPISDSLVRIKILELLFALAGHNQHILDPLLDLRRNFRPDITALVENNLLNPVSINQLALLAGRSLSSFRRDFLSIYNMPPSQWIRERRLKKATEFLQTTNMTITDICYTLGFENLAHFSRLFKAQFGYSPSVYRSQSA